MPKQVYVYPGNINDADTVEGTRQVLEPAVDKVYVYNSGSNSYVDVNNAANTLPHDVYLFPDSQHRSNSVRENYFHYTADAPTDNSGKPFIPLVTAGSSFYQRYGIIKVDETQPNGYSVVETGDQYAYTKYYYIPVKTKILWDNATETIIIALSDVIGTDSNSSNRTNMSRKVTVLYKYDKTTDSITVIQALDNSALIRKAPISGTYFYYDSGADTYTFYQLLLGPTGTLQIRKVTATQTGVSEVLETVNLAGASITPKFPDSVDDPYYFFQRTGLIEKKPWVELTAPLETNTSQFTIALIDSPNLTSSTSREDLLKELVLYFERGQYSYDSGTSTWTFTVSSEFSVDSLTKQFYTYNAKFLNGVNGIVPARHPGRPESTSYSFDYVERLRFDSFDFATALTDLTYEISARIHGFSGTDVAHEADYFGTFDASGNPVINYWLPLGGFETQGNRFYHSFQIDHSDTPPIIFFSNGGNLYPAIKALSQTLVDNLAPSAGKYLYDISQASTKGNTYFLVNRIYNSRQYPYLVEALTLPGASKKFIVVTDSVRNLPAIQAAQLQSLNSTTALNYSAGGTITSVYRRDANGLEALTMWIRSGSTMHAIFSIEFERALDPSSILKYIYDNTNVDNLFVVRNASFTGTELSVFTKLGQFFHSDEFDATFARHAPTVATGKVTLRPGGFNATSVANKGNRVYFNSATGTLLVVDPNDTSSIVLSSFMFYNRTIDLNGTNNYRHYKTQFVSSGGALTTLYNNYYLQAFRDFWTADYEDTVEVTIGTNIYRYVVVGKYNLDYKDHIVVVLEDIV